MKLVGSRPAVIPCCDWTDAAVAECYFSTLKTATVDFHYVPVAVEKFSIVNCAFLVRLVAENCPDGSVILGCVDTRAPGVPRFPIALRLKERNITFLGPNTGTCALLVSELHLEAAVRIEHSDWWRFSFVGRDLLSGLAGSIVSGTTIESLGERLDDTRLVTFSPRKWQVLHIDNYGNIKLNARQEDLEYSSYQIDGQTIRFCSPDESRFGAVTPESDLVLVRGSSFGFLELQRRGHTPSDLGAAAVLGTRVGDILQLVPTT